MPAQQGEIAPKPDTKAWMSNHRATALIDGQAYFRAIDQEITNLLASPTVGRFFYMSAWWLGLLDVGYPIRVDNALPVNNLWEFSDPYPLQALILPGSSQPLLTRLGDMARANPPINVRVMAWVSPFNMYERVAKATGKANANMHTLLSIDALRGLIGADHVLVNTLAHSLGAAHYKMAVCGDQTSMRAFTSGIDPERGRLEPPGAGGGWHDVGVKIEGSATSLMYQFYKDMWDEQLKRPVETFKLNGRTIVSHDPAWGQLIARDAPGLPPNTSQQHVQVLRTIPQMNFNQSGPRRRGALIRPFASAAEQIALGTIMNQIGFQRPPFSFARDGVFEFKVALKKAIFAAQRYIFIADQALIGLEIMDWINRRMLQNPNVRVILFYGFDPADPPNTFLDEAIHKHLAANLPVDANGDPDEVAAWQWERNVVHSKVTIIDDIWCAIGSANCMRRSLYTDIELAVGILEVPTPAARLPADWAEEQFPAAHGKLAPSFVQAFRRDLWAHYCGIPLDPGKRKPHENDRYTQLLKIDRALNLWKAWGGQRIPGIDLRREMSSILSIAQKFNQTLYDLNDTDSRQKF
jgi:phosphatidylserine/phosphatidylglycerophosphate/cardiolipin synthase-like enzyme